MRQSVPLPMQLTAQTPQQNRFGGPVSSHMTPGMKRPGPQLPPPPGFGAMPNPRNPARAKRRRVLDRSIMNEISQSFPEGKSYLDLIAIEQHLDALLVRKRVMFQEALKRPVKLKKKLRIYISHVFNPGREPDVSSERSSLEIAKSSSTLQRDHDSTAVPTWELRVEGRMVEDCPPNQYDIPPSQVPGNQPLPATRCKRKFSSFFKSLIIELDKNVYGPDNHLVEWHRGPNTAETDGFQVKRPGDQDVNCNILLMLDYQPMKYKLHPRLAKLLGVAVDSRPHVIELLWQYIRAHKLQDVNDRDFINCDYMLEQIFSTKKMRFIEIPSRVVGLLSPPEPIVLNHTIRRTDSDKPVTACYDIDVELDDPTKAAISGFLQGMNNNHDINVLDNKLYDLCDQVTEWKSRVDFFKRFADNPLDMLQNWLKSQENELHVMKSESDVENERRVETYLTPNITEGVFRYFYNRIQIRRKELELGVMARPY